jgi:dTDP-4-dehydrorhamnose reductase
VRSRFIIIGAESLIGGTLRHRWCQEGHEVIGTFLDPTAAATQGLHLDLKQTPANWPQFPTSEAAVICSGITSLEICRRAPAASQLINVTRTLELVRRLQACADLVVFLSSNLVFDGSRPRRRADDPVGPQTEYGRQKAAVEAGLKEQGGPWAVVRLTKVMHPRFSLLQQWLAALRAGREIRPFSDFVCAPIPLSLVVHGLARVVETHGTGYWQFSASDDITYPEMARLVARQLTLSCSLIHPVKSDDVLPVEHVPSHTTLDTDRAERELGLTMPTSQATLRQICAET